MLLTAQEPTAHLDQHRDVGINLRKEGALGWPCKPNVAEPQFILLHSSWSPALSKPAITEEASPILSLELNNGNWL